MKKCVHLPHAIEGVHASWNVLLLDSGHEMYIGVSLSGPRQTLTTVFFIKGSL